MNCENCGGSLKPESHGVATCSRCGWKTQTPYPLVYERGERWHNFAPNIDMGGDPRYQAEDKKFYTYHCPSCDGVVDPGTLAGFCTNMDCERYQQGSIPRRLLKRSAVLANVPALDELTPHRWDRECYEVANTIAHHWPQLPHDSGYYIHPTRGPGDHAWNRAADGTIVDMTATQHDYTGPVDEPEDEHHEFAAPQHPEIVTPDMPQYANYISFTHQEQRAQQIAHNLGHHEPYYPGEYPACRQCKQMFHGTERVPGTSNGWYTSAQGWADPRVFEIADTRKPKEEPVGTCADCGQDVVAQGDGFYACGCGDMQHPTSLRLAAMTRKQMLEEAAALDAYHKQPDQSKILHEWPDGWSIRQPTTYGDLNREGQLMGHCWSEDYRHDDPDGDEYDIAYGPWNQWPGRYSDPLGYTNARTQEFVPDESHFSLRDPDNLPHASMGGEYGDVSGRHNSALKPEYWKRLYEFDPKTYPDYEKFGYNKMAQVLPSDIVDPPFWHEAGEYDYQAPEMCPKCNRAKLVMRSDGVHRKAWYCANPACRYQEVMETPRLFQQRLINRQPEKEYETQFYPDRSHNEMAHDPHYPNPVDWLPEGCSGHWDERGELSHDGPCPIHEPAPVLDMQIPAQLGEQRQAAAPQQSWAEMQVDPEQAVWGTDHPGKAKQLNGLWDEYAQMVGDPQYDHAQALAWLRPQLIGMGRDQQAVDQWLEQERLMNGVDNIRFSAEWLQGPMPTLVMCDRCWNQYPDSEPQCPKCGTPRKVARHSAIWEHRGQPTIYDPDPEEWMTGQCAAWAIAHQQLHPDLRFGMHYEALSPDEQDKREIEDGYRSTHEIQHVFTHDDNHAYDAEGKHPMPFNGWDHSEFDLGEDDVRDSGMFESGYMPEHEWLQRHDPRTASNLSIMSIMPELPPRKVAAGLWHPLADEERAYHVAPTHVRDSIAQHGLRAQRPYAPGMQKGVYLHLTPEAAHKWANPYGDHEDYDVWEVNPQVRTLAREVANQAESYFYPVDIPADRVQRHSSSMSNQSGQPTSPPTLSTPSRTRIGAEWHTPREQYQLEQHTQGLQQMPCPHCYSTQSVYTDPASSLAEPGLYCKDCGTHWLTPNRPHQPEWYH